MKTYFLVSTAVSLGLLLQFCTPCSIHVVRLSEDGCDVPCCMFDIRFNK